MKEPTALDEVVESVLHRLEPTLGGVRVRTIFRDAPDVPVDPVQIDQVLSNLIENAIRFSPRQARSRSRWRRGGPACRCGWRIRGPGIAPEDRERVFEAFTQLGTSAPDATGGSGLGLAISRAIVLAHGGGIEGTPAVAPRWCSSSPPEARLRSGRKRRPGGRSLTRVLVVDDEPQIRRAMRTSLEAHGYEVRTVGTGEEAVVAAAEDDPELVLLDLGLPTSTAPR